MPQPGTPPPPPPVLTSQQQHTNTAADLLNYDTYQDLISNTEQLTRVASANEEWVVQKQNGDVFYIKFDNNFSKKHLATFSKKQNPPQATSIDSKNQKTLANRDKSVRGKDAHCGEQNCGHKKYKHPNDGPCNAVGCHCTAFITG
jgi:hypothetical protein